MTFDAAQLLRDHGVQVTAQRLAVMRTVSQQPHLTADDVTVACLTAADDNGFEIDEADVAYWGRCPQCLVEVP